MAKLGTEKNMFCKGQRVPSDEYRDNYDRIFRGEVHKRSGAGRSRAEKQTSGGEK